MDPNAAQARWDARYDKPEYHFGETPNAFLAGQAARLRPGMKALAISDGEGRNGVWLARQGLAVTSFDLSPRGVEKAKALAARHGVAIDMRIADIATWNWTPEAYDLVAGIFFQYAPPPLRARIFAGIVETLRPGGLLLLQGYTPRQLAYGTGGPPEAENMYTPELLRDSFKALEIIALNEHDDRITEGPGHDGMSALIDLVARKPA
ncbi:MAG: class I SAM-dependent methyltransferase [Alphaproteobacteria bacterium]|nr:class I SAM-dependent methyltransferase [Alphaproteobacteria bacterium]